MSDLPSKTLKSEQKVVQFFDTYFQKRVEFAASEYDALIGFFRSRDFSVVSARTISQVLLTQAKAENIKIFTVIDTLGKLDFPNLNQVVTKVLNASRDQTSQLGYKTAPNLSLYEVRGIADPVIIDGNQRIQVIDAEVDTTDYLEAGYVEIGYVI